MKLKDAIYILWKKIEVIYKWLVGGIWQTTSDALMVTGPTGKDVGLVAKSSDNTGNIFLGVGVSGINHGVYSRTLSRWLVAADDTNVYLDGANTTLSTLDLTWLNNTSGTGLYVSRWCKIVTLSIWNPTKLAAGNNIVGKLPEGYRPAREAIFLLIAPTASGTPTNALSLRATIRGNGDIEIYNYRSTAISSATNASGTITFVAS